MEKTIFSNTTIPIGDRLKEVITVLYRAGINILLVGPTGIGKTRIIRETCHDMGLVYKELPATSIEPFDLMGMMRNEDGRVKYDPPSFLPSQHEKRGIVDLVEVNRTNPAIMNALFSLLSDRGIGEYRLPEGWIFTASINPAGEDYIHALNLDTGFRNRFWCVNVTASVKEWVAWSKKNSIHPAIINLVLSDYGIFDQITPRVLEDCSRVIRSMTPEQIHGCQLFDIFSQVLPRSMIERLRDSDSGLLFEEIDVRELLKSYHTAKRFSMTIKRYKQSGQMDAIKRMVDDVAAVISGSELSVLDNAGSFSIEALKGLLLDLPGDYRNILIRSIRGNPLADRIPGISEILTIGGAS